MMGSLLAGSAQSLTNQHTKTLLTLKMKHSFFCVAAVTLFTLFPFLGQSQDTLFADHPQDAQAYFPGLSTYLSKHLLYPAKAEENRTEGVVEVAVIIDKKGEVRAVNVLKGIGSGCDEAVVATLSAMPRWMPRIRKGQPAAQTVLVPVRFRMQ